MFINKAYNKDPDRSGGDGTITLPFNSHYVGLILIVAGPIALFA
jgi:hypothetical protein